MNKNISKSLLIGISLIGSIFASSQFPQDWEQMSTKEKTNWINSKGKTENQEQKIEKQYGKLPSNVWNPNAVVEKKEGTTQKPTVYFDPEGRSKEAASVTGTANLFGTQVKEDLSPVERNVFETFIENPVSNATNLESFLILVESYVIPALIKKNPNIIEEANRCIIALDAVYDQYDTFFDESLENLKNNKLSQKLDFVYKNLKSYNIK